MAVILFRPFGLKISYAVGKSWSRLNMFLLRILCGISYDVEIRGELPDRPCIYISNHQSAWETIAFPSIIPPFMWVLKRELFYIPFFGWCLLALGHIGIDRKAGAKSIRKVNEKGKDILERGYNIVIFPEGTRSAPGTLGQFNPGGISLALNSGAPIVPVIQNAGRLWSRKSFGKRPGKITVIIEEPISTEGVSPSERKKLNQRVKDIIKTRLDEIRG